MPILLANLHANYLKRASHAGWGVGRDAFTNNPPLPAPGARHPNPTPGVAGDHVDRILPAPPPEQMETDKVCLRFATGSRDVPRVSWSKL